MANINLLAVVLATVLVFVIGGLWYGPLFGKAWQADTGVTREQVGHPAKVFGCAAAFGLIGAYATAVLCGPAPQLTGATLTGLGVGVAVAAGFGINYMFAAKSWRLFLIDGVYSLILFTAMGAVIGAMG